MPPDFGNIRSLLHDAPARRAWETLCDMLDGSEEFEDTLLPYTSELLEHWPATLRRAPRRWIERIAHGERVPQIKLARALVVEQLPPLGLERLLRRRGLDHVEVLDLHNLKVGDNGAALLARGRWPHLRQLDLGLNDMSEQGARSLATYANLPCLRKLDLHRNPIGPHGADALAQTHWLPRVTHLNLSACDIRGRGAEALSPLTHLTHLNLRWNDLGERGLDALLSMELHHLESLDISRNRLSATSLQRLAHRAQWFSLQHLRLGFQDLSDEGLTHLAQAPFLSNLHTLDLSASGITARGVEALTRAPLRLRALTLSDNPIGDEGARALAACQGLSGLERIYLHNTEIGEDGVRALLDPGALPALEHISITGNAISGPPPTRPGLELQHS